jgi:hypothetical protein
LEVEMNIVSRPASKEYRENFESIFGKKKPEPQPEPKYPWPVEAEVLGDTTEEHADGC